MPPGSSHFSLIIGEQLTSPLVFLCENTEPPQLNKHLFLVASSCPHWFHGRCSRWWWDPVHCRGRQGPAEHVQVPFSSHRRPGTPRCSWIYSAFVISLLRCCSHLARVVVWMMPFSPLIECSQLLSCGAFPDPGPLWMQSMGTNKVPLCQ